MGLQRKKNNRKPRNKRGKLSRLIVTETVNKILSDGTKVFKGFNFVRNPNTWLRTSI